MCLRGRKHEKEREMSHPLVSSVRAGPWEFMAEHLPRGAGQHSEAIASGSAAAGRLVKLTF